MSRPATARYESTRQVAAWLDAHGVTYEINEDPHNPRADKVWVTPDPGVDFAISVGDTVTSAKIGDASNASEQ